MVNIQGMTPKELTKLESRLRAEIAKTERKREKTRRKILALAKRSGFTLEELFDVPAAADRVSAPRPSPARIGRPKGSGVGKPGAGSAFPTAKFRAIPAPKSMSTTRPAKKEVSAKHMKMAASLPTKAAMIRALLPFGYARSAIAAALGTSYHNVYQVEKASKAKAKAKGFPKASAKTKSKPAERAVSEVHKAEVTGLPTIAAKVRALLPHGYSRNAIAAALGTNYQNVYQAARTPAPNAKAKPGGNPGARAKTKSKPQAKAGAKAKAAKRDVSADHKGMIKNMPSAAAKVRALLPYGYSRNAIAAAVGKTYQYVYQVEHAPKPKNAGK